MTKPSVNAWLFSQPSANFSFSADHSGAESYRASHYGIRKFASLREFLRSGHSGGQKTRRASREAQQSATAAVPTLVVVREALMGFQR
jgi:hypothetical protein